MATYRIDIERGTRSGRLSFLSGTTRVLTDCWWDPKMVIVPKDGGYLCVSTVMAKLKDSVTRKPRPAIWFGKGVKYNGGAKTGDGAFIHEGTSAAWSDGCIVIPRNEMLKIIEAVPRGQYDIDVYIRDTAPAI